MHNTSLLEILRTFTPEEITKFEDLVSSPYFNKKSGVINLYKHIKKYAPEFNTPKLEKEKVWNVLYPGKEFNYGVFKNLIYDLTKLAEEYTTLEYYERENFQMSYSLLDSLYEREIKNLFKTKFHTLNKNINKLKKNKNISIEDYYDIMLRIYILKWGFSMQFDRHPKREDEFTLHTVFRTSSLLYSIFETCINALILSGSNFYDKDKNPILTFIKKADSKNLISELLESIKPVSIEMYEILNMYYKYYRSLSDNTSVEKYFDFKEALISNSSNFSKHDRHNLYNGLRNCIDMLNSPEINNSNEILDITKIQINAGVMLNPDGLLNNIEFINCIQTACSLGNSDFIKDFSDKFIKYLPKETRENMHKFSLANLYFTENEFQKSMAQILTINYDLFVMKYLLKNLQMMNYYELNDFNSFLSSLDSYKHFLSKNKSVTEGFRENQALFVNFLNKLFRLKEKFDGFELKNLKNKIVLHSVPKKQWLLKKADELKSYEIEVTY